MVEGLDSVIEKLTEKVAISAEALRPIATETLRQIQLRGRWLSPLPYALGM